MALFQLLAIPVAALLILALLNRSITGANVQGKRYARASRGTRGQDGKAPDGGARQGAAPGWAPLTIVALKGVLCSVPAVLTWLAANTLVGSSYRPGKLYLHLLLRDHLAYHVWAVIFLLLVVALPHRRYRPGSTRGAPSLWEAVAFLGGFYAAAPVLDWVAMLTMATAQSLFLLPLVRISVLVATSVLFVALFDLSGLPLAGVVAALAALPELLSLESSSYAMMHGVTAWIIAVLSAVGAAGMVGAMVRSGGSLARR